MNKTVRLPALKAVREVSRQLEGSPALKAAREVSQQLEGSPALKAAREVSQQLEGSPALKAVREVSQQLEDSPALKAVREVSRQLEDSPALKAAREVSRQLEDSPALKAAREVSRQLEDPPALKAVREVSRLALEIERVIVPTPTVLQALSVSVARTVQPVQDRFSSIGEWYSSVGERMAGIGTPWAMAEHLSIAGAGFARIARLHDCSTGSAPFGPQAVEIFDEELGQPIHFDMNVESQDRDMAAIDAGLNPELIAFPRRVYSEVLFSAGFEIRIESLPDVVSDSGDDSGVFDSQYYRLLAEIETRLRMIVKTELRRLIGDRWYKQRVPEKMRERWQERRETDQRERGDSYPIEFYADFMDLSQIICQKDNWRDVFQQYFMSKDDVQVSLQRLNPVRKALAHNRPLVRSDQLILVSEGSRVMAALGVPWFRRGQNGR